MFLQKLFNIRFIIIMILFIFIVSACGINPEKGLPPITEKKMIITIATGGTTGPYFVIGNEIAKVIEREMSNTSASVHSTGGGVENVQLIIDGQAELGLVMADIASLSYEKKLNNVKSGENLRAVTALYPNFVHIISLKNRYIKNIEDLKGRKVGVGAVGSGTEVNTRTILQYHGITYDDIDEYYLSYKDSVIELIKGNVDAAFLTSGLPNSMIIELTKTHDVQFIPITSEKVQEISTEFPYYSSNIIPTNTYNNDLPVHTATITNLLLTREDIDEDVIYDVTRIIFNNLNHLKQAHLAATDITLENSQNGLTVPLHKGAKKFFEEHQVK